MAKTSALDLFNSLSLEDIRSQIAALDDQIAGIEKQRDSLRQLERAIDIRDNGKPKKNWSRKKKAKPENSEDSGDSDGETATPEQKERPAKKGGRQVSPETVALRQRIYQYLRIHGPMGCSELSKALKADYGKVQNALYDTQFKNVGGMWALS